MSWKAGLPKEMSSHKEVGMEKRSGFRKRKVMKLAGGNSLAAGKDPGDQGYEGSLPLGLLTHKIAASPGKSSMRIVVQKSYAQSCHICYFPGTSWCRELKVT